MGVQGLLSYIRSHPLCKNVLSLSDFAFRVARTSTNKERCAEILCDFSSVASWLCNGADAARTSTGNLIPSAQVFGGDLNVIVKRITRFVQALRHVSIEPVFFVSTPVCRDKEEFILTFPVIKESYVHAVHDNMLIQQVCEGSLSSRENTVSPSCLTAPMIQQIQMTLSSLDVKVVYCMGSGMLEMSAYVRADHVCGALSTNPEFAVMRGSSFIDCQTFDLDGRLRIKGSSHLNEIPSDIVCSFSTPALLAKCLGLEEDSLVDLAILCGNDYSQELNQALQVCRHLSLKHLAVDTVRNLLSGQDPSAFDNIPALVYLRKISPKYNVAIQRSRLLYSGIFTNEYDTETKGRKLVSFQSCILAGLERNGLYRRLIVTEYPGTDHPVIEDLLLPVRRVMYMLMGLHQVQEIGPSGKHSFAEINVSVDVAIPSLPLLEQILSLSVSSRCIVMFHLLVNSWSFVCARNVQALLDLHECPSELSVGDAFLSACLSAFLNKKLVTHAVKSSVDIDALLATVLCCRAGIGPFQCNLQPTMRIVTICSWFSHLLFLASMLMELLGLQEYLPAPCSSFQPLTASFFMLATTGEDMIQVGESVGLLNQGRKFIKDMLALPAVCKFRSACGNSSLDSIIPTVKTKLFSAAVNEVVGSRDKLSPKLNLIDQKCSSEQLLVSVAPSLLAKGEQLQCSPPLLVPSPVPKLPIIRYRQKILQMIRKYTVVLIIGEAGCGKSTMVPQYIAEDIHPELTSRRHCVLVTQPRRVGVLNLAKQVASHLREPCGNSIGYQVKGKQCISRETKIVYCTAGCFLQVRCTIYKQYLITPVMINIVLCGHIIY